MLSQPKQPKPNPITIIRHGQSQYNNRAQILRNKLGISATWQEYLANPQFMQFKYSEQMLDCRLSVKGRQQCEKLHLQMVGKMKAGGKQREEVDYDLILVSPLFRTLQSCSIIFKHIINNPTQHNTPIIVHPIFSQSLRCACDVSYNLPQAKKQFPYYDYSLVDGRQSQWYIDNQVPLQQAKYRQMLKENNVDGYRQTAMFINKYMGETHDFQSGIDLMVRAERARNVIKQYQKKYNRIAIVSHFYTIGYMITDPTLFNSQGKPSIKFNVPNAHPIHFQLS